MTIAVPTQQAIIRWLQTQALGTIESLAGVSGGCICDNYYLRTSSGDRFFIKTCPGGPDNLFPAEAEGLAALARGGTLRIPEVYHAGVDFLALEYIEPGAPGENYWHQLAQGLAELHGAPQPAFGFGSDNYCGSTPQPNPRCSDGYTFFGEQRLRYQGGLAVNAGLMETPDFDQLGRLISRLPELIPAQPPALIHGDLWSGNIYCDSQGRPVLLDPACHCSWREADIAMTRLFGALPPDFYRHYQRLLPMPSGWEQRMDLYNLYHLLNHLNLFGESYLQQVRSVIQRYL